ncbi:MAG: ankyrin repeat domain-containing protein [Cyanobacteria bacterium SID2]|nr:ankyrin repeat domain-containing protein [Cyanobacteria bacterium SID2]MBP0002259.1 ankyrin repeat domain-containing protein [Cyanobacteria bacterium SBC]
MNYDRFISPEKLFNAIEDRNFKNLKELINSGCDVNRSDSEDDITPLMYAATIGDLEIVKLLVEACADVNAKSAYGNSALFDAAFSENQKVFKYLEPLTNIQIQLAVKRYIKTGKTYPPRAYEMVNTLTEQALHGNLEAVAFILSKGINVNALDSKGETALLKAIQSKKDDVVHFLLKAGADPNIKEQCERGRTPLIVALQEGSEKAFQMLLEARADINASSDRGATALIAAVWVRNVTAVRQLLQMAADTKPKQDEAGASHFRRMPPPPSVPPLSKGRMGGVPIAKLRCTHRTSCLYVKILLLL